MSEHGINQDSVERAQLLPVAGGIVGIYLVIITVAYFVGNMIYQIP